MNPFVPFVVAGFAIWAICEAWTRWRWSRVPKDPQAPRPRLMPESLFVVRVTASQIVCERPDGQAEWVEWDDLQKVEIVTTDEGPMHPDVFWVLHGTGRGCAIPQGATGESELLHRLQKLPAFDNRAVIEAMGSTSNRRFLCWQKSAQASPPEASAR